jgi:hypothetical protein
LLAAFVLLASKTDFMNRSAPGGRMRPGMPSGEPQNHDNKPLAVGKITTRTTRRGPNTARQKKLKIKIKNGTRFTFPASLNSLGIRFKSANRSYLAAQ